MNFAEADRLVKELDGKNCGGKPLAVSTTPSNGPTDSDSAEVVCRLNLGRPCLFAGGAFCLKGLKAIDLSQ